MNAISRQEPKQDFVGCLNKDALRGKRLGVSMELVRFQGRVMTANTSAGILAVEPVFLAALNILRSLEAKIVDVCLDDLNEFAGREWVDRVWPAEFKESLEEYLKIVK